MNKFQFARSEYQIKLYKIYHLNGLKFLPFTPFDCQWDCCKYEFSEAYKYESEGS